ncbi:MAG TPA: DUF4331 family protein, partial [Candidatus Limnocylindria bacterium]
MRALRFIEIGVGFAAAAMIAVVATAPLGSRAADHLDAPNLASREDADINDVYVFEAATPGRTAIAVTTSPAAGVIGPINYATNVRYKINVDRNGDAVEDLAYVLDFSTPSGGSQAYTVTRYTGANARTLAQGVALGGGMRGAITSLKDGGVVFAGLRADPFFFDLAAFRHVVLGAANGRTGFCDQPGPSGIDFFAAFNTNAIVIEVPNDSLSDSGGKIGVWSTTLDSTTGAMIDQMGRPAINTV